MDNMQQIFNQLRGAFSSGPEAGAKAWAQLQNLAGQGFMPAQLFVATQKLKSPPPLYDLEGGVQLLETLLNQTESSANTTQPRSAALYRLGEALFCNFPDQMSAGYKYTHEAARLGHVEAQLNLAYCLRQGLGVPVDVEAAIHYLRDAAKQGHPRAFYELGVLLGQSDDVAGHKQEAMSALQRAASFNYPAAAAIAGQLAQNGSLVQPKAERHMISSEPRVERITALLDPMECSHLAALSMPHLKPSRVISDQRTGQSSGGRTSEGMNYHHGLRDLVVTNIIHRLCAIAGCEFSQTEALTVLMYIPGGEYRVHPDYFSTDTEAGKMQLANGGQRFKTMICYLNTVGGGGQTEFPDLGITIDPEPGSVVYFDNAEEEGQPYIQSRHAGLPVTAGSKWISTLWLRQYDYDQWDGQ
jgi:hypothetical protein